MNKSFCSHARKAVVALAAVGAFAGPLAPAPAAAASPATTAPVSSVSMSISGCTVTVTYSWNGYSGKTDQAWVRLLVNGGSTGIAINGVSGRSGKVSSKFSLSPSVMVQPVQGSGALLSNTGTNLGSAFGTAAGIACA